MKWSRGMRGLMVTVAMMLLLSQMASATALGLNQFLLLEGPGLAVAESGVGLDSVDVHQGAVEEITINIPYPAIEAYLFWTGRTPYLSDVFPPPKDLPGPPVWAAPFMSEPYPDQVLMLNGTVVTGVNSGYETQWPGADPGNVQTLLNLGFYADVTGIVQAAGSGGDITFQVADGDTSNNLDTLNGAGLLVVYTDPNDEVQYRIEGYAGLDFAYMNDSQLQPNKYSDPIFFRFDAIGQDRVGDLIIFAGDCEADRPDGVVAWGVTEADMPDSIDMVLEDYYVLSGSDGESFDTVRFEVPIAAGKDLAVANVSSLVYRDEFGNPLPEDPDSIMWTLGLLRIPLEGTASLGDYVWMDVNGNGVQDDGEPGVPGVLVTLMNCDGDWLGETWTDDNGYYIFDNLLPGCYQVMFTPEAGDVFTVQNAGADDALDSDADFYTGLTHLIDLEAGEHDPTIDAGLINTSECLPCDGKVTWLSFQYLGPDNTFVQVYQARHDPPVFEGTLSYGDVFRIDGQDSKGTLNTEIYLMVDGKDTVQVHTSCSQPIGPGMIFGDFLVIAGASRNGGLLCPEETPITPSDNPPPPPEEPSLPPEEECGPCDGKVTYLELQYTGTQTAQVVAIQRKAKDPGFEDGVIFAGDVDPLTTFELFGHDKKGTLNTEVTIELTVDGMTDVVSIHTSCSQPIGPGMSFGPFMVLAGESRNGGPLCEY